MHQQDSSRPTSDAVVQALIAEADRLFSQGRFAEAIAGYEQALQHVPDDARLWSNLANILSRCGQHEPALAAYSRAVGICPDNAMMQFNLGSALLDAGQIEPARTHLQMSARLDPNFAWTFERLAELCQRANDPGQAVRFLKRSRRLRPDDLGLAWKQCLAALPICYESQDHIDAARTSYEQSLRTLLDTLDPANPAMLASALEGLRHTPFYLAYQGRNDVELQRLHGRYVSRITSARFPQWSNERAMPPAEPDGRWRIGVVGKYFASHSVWNLPLRGWLEHLDRSRFRLFGYATAPCPDSPAVNLCERFVQGDAQLDDLARIIDQDRLHALIFPEIGMDWKTLCLAGMRLAPVQLAGAGHPQTTGLPTVDAFLSSALMEPANAEEHYSERLIRLPNLSSYNYPPADTPTLTRDQLNCSDQDILFFSPQSLFKYLPAYDDIFARIAGHVPHARFLFIRHEISTQATECFVRRLCVSFARHGLDPQRHLVFLPRLAAPVFTAVCGACDIFLDNPGWSGNNTSLQALWQGTPIVTMPGELMRSRHTAANLTMTGITDTICTNVDDYVHKAATLGSDPISRTRLAAALKGERHTAFFDLACVRALENVLEDEIRHRLG